MSQHDQQILISEPLSPDEKRALRVTPPPAIPEAVQVEIVRAIIEDEQALFHSFTCDCQQDRQGMAEAIVAALRRAQEGGKP